MSAALSAGVATAALWVALLWTAAGAEGEVPAECRAEEFGLSIVVAVATAAAVAEAFPFAAKVEERVRVMV